MRYLLIVIVIASGFILRPFEASAICSYTMTNCLTEEFSWCAYDDDGFWYTIYDYSGGDLDSGDSTYVEYGCNPIDDSCYIIGEEDPDVWLCQEYDVSGFTDGCGNYICVDVSDGSIKFNTGSSEYCCSDNICTTDCS